MSTPGQSAVLECPEQVSRQDAVEAPPTGIAPLEHDPSTPGPELSPGSASLTERSSDEAGLQSEDGVLTPADPTCNESLPYQPDASVTDPQSEGLVSLSLAPPPPPETDSTQLADCSAPASSVAVASNDVNEAGTQGTQAERDSAVGFDSSASPLVSSSPPLPYNTSSEIGPGLDSGPGSSIRPEESRFANGGPTDSVVAHETLTPDDADATPCVLASAGVASAVPPDVQLEDDKEDDPDRDAHIMHSALLVDVEPSSDTLYEPDTTGVNTVALSHNSNGADSGSSEDDEDAEWTSVEHADGQTRTPRATTPVRSLSPSTREEDGEGEPVPTMTSDLAASAVLLTESEYCQLGDFQAAIADAEAERTDLPSAHHPPAFTAAAPSRVKHTPTPLVLTNSADRPHDDWPQHDDAPPSPGPGLSGSPSPSSSSPTATTTRGGSRVRVHTPDKPDWAVAPAAQTTDHLKKKARRHSYEHPDWAVAPDPDLEASEGAGAGHGLKGKRKGRHSDPGGVGLASASLDGSLGGGPGGRERGRGKRRTHRGRHSR